MNERHLVTKFNYKNINVNCNKNPASVEQFEHFLAVVDSYNLCVGGPRTTYGKNALLLKAKKDNGVWRHVDCPIFLEEGKGNFCRHCARIDSMISTYITRHNKKKTKIHITALSDSPHIRHSFLELQKRSNRKTRKNRIQQEAIDDLKNSLKALKKLKEENCSLNKILNNYKRDKISNNQVNIYETYDFLLKSQLQIF